MRRNNGWTLAGWLILLGAALLTGCPGPDTGGEIPVRAGIEAEQVMQWNNLGVAWLERHRYGRAEEQFGKVIENAPDWPVGHVNLGIAYMNLRRNREALEAFDRALSLDPENRVAAYCKGLIFKNQGQSEEAIAWFQRLIDAGIEDTDLYYNLGLLHFREKRSRQASGFLQRAVELNRYNASAVFKLASVFMELGERQEADRWMARFREMSEAGEGTTAGQQYTEQGRYAVAISVYGEAGVRSAPLPADGIRFLDVSGPAGLTFIHSGPGSFAGEQGAAGSARLRGIGSGAAWADIDGDGDPDLYLTDLGGPNALYRNRGDGTFEEVGASAGVADTGEGMAAYFGDYDNDGDPDLFVANLGSDRLYRNRGDGTFEDVTAEAGIEAPDPSLGAAFADIDHDGDLDLYVTAGSGNGGDSIGQGKPNRLYRNNGNGTFTERAAEVKISGGRKESLGVLFSDFDNDRDIDLFFWNDGSPPEIQTNLREDRFRDLAGEMGLPAGGKILGAVAADLNKDGYMDLVVTGHGRPAAILLNQGGRRFLPDPGAVEALRVTAGWTVSTGLQVADFDNDGFLDLFLVGEGKGGEGKVLLLRGLGKNGWTDITVEAGLAGLIPAFPRGVALADYDGDGDADILVTSNGGPAVLLENRGGERNFSLQMITRGLSSNRQGIGTKVEVQAGGLWQKQEVSGGSGYLSQNDPRLTFGLGERGQADFVRFLWPGGVLQAEMEKPAGEPFTVEELDRKGSSCPTLFAWTGDRYEFVSDLLGVGGIGFLERPWKYVNPDPTEYLKLDPIRIRPRQGDYHLSVVGQLEEVVYLDAVRLVAVDHPDGTEIYPDERFSTGPDKPAEKIHRVRERFFPAAAWEEDRLDVRERILRRDRIYPDGFELLSFAGYAAPHSLTLSFLSLPAAERWVLYMYGWVDYEYSSSTLAAHQAGIELAPPALEINDPATGNSRTYRSIGFPAGMPKMMTFEIPDPLPAGPVQLKLTTNMRIYYDQIFLAPAREEIPVRITRVPAGGARLRFLGSPREFSPDGLRPLLYDYQLATGGFPWKRMAGAFTRFGEVTELLDSADDRFVIMGHGEEVLLTFPAGRFPALPPGWKRSFLFFADGFCKDMDPNTAFPDSVEPLPFHAMSAYPYPSGEKFPDSSEHRRYRKEYNTRRVNVP